MKQSQLFTKTRKEAPAGEQSKNAQLLIRAGYIFKEMAGIYSYLPLGLRVLKNIENIIREEMNAVGGVEMQTSTLQNKDTREKTNRRSDEIVDTWFKTELKSGGQLGLSFTNEEAFAHILTDYVSSYKDLPIYLYDFKNIFRNEARAKSGIMRGREFYWKALYSFSKDEAQHQEFYEKMKIAYQNVFTRVGLGDQTFLTFASGGTFSEFSHEFQTLADIGEDTIYLDEVKKIAINKEVFNDEVLYKLGLDKSKLVEKKAVEVGNIFTLADKFSKPLKLTYKDENGADQDVFMGSYGIGISRLLGVIVELLSDGKGIILPDSIAPFKVHLLSLGTDEVVLTETQKIYQELESLGIEVLRDDRDFRAGEKFADSDLIGIPYRILVSPKTLESGKLELKNRKTGEVKMIEFGELRNTFI
ncbi:proline--tRNA ligase [candidate division SR1 bacterium]|nr:proline--tRNA ligase [candidate division SR1 bacterium]